MTELLLIRHGETDWNRELRFQGQVDVPLNATGHEQARRLAQRLAQRLAGEQVHHLYSSDLLRTRQTAEPSALELALDNTADAGLREQNFGLVDGMRVDDIKLQHAEAWNRWICFDEGYAFSGGECTRDFHGRVLGSLRRIASLHPGQTVLVVTHGGVLDMVWRTARGLSLSGPRQTEIPNGGLSRVRMAGDAVEVLGWADVGHLAGMAAQPRYDQSKLAQAVEPSPSAA